MPSLKDLRNRIASVKATQKITKAMQMVAAAKLRRAQAAAEAARPYAERMETVLANLASGVTGSERAEADRRHRLGPGPSAGGLHGRARPLRRVQLLDRASGARQGERAQGRRQDGQDHLRRQEGLRHPAPAVRERHHRADRPARLQAGRLRQCRDDRAEHPGALRQWRIRRRDAVLLEVQIGDLAAPDGAAHHSGRNPGRAPRRPTRSTITSPTKARSSRRCCRATSRCRCCARSSRMPPPSRARACRRWIPPRAMPAR